MATPKSSQRAVSEEEDARLFSLSRAWNVKRSMTAFQDRVSLVLVQAVSYRFGERAEVRA